MTRYNATEELTKLFATWELAVDQARQDDRISPGAVLEFKRLIYEHTSNVLRIAATEAQKWTRRCDDAKRIPDLLHDLSREVGQGLEEKRT